MLFRAKLRRTRLKQLSRADLVRNASMYPENKPSKFFGCSSTSSQRVSLGEGGQTVLNPFALNITFTAPRLTSTWPNC
ncbi:unnamed protein product [Ixodes hexagonus]